MKKLVSIALAILGLTITAQAADIKIVTVDVNKIFEGYFKAQEGQKKIKSAMDTLQTEFQGYLKEGQDMVDERNKLVEQLDNPVLSEDAKKDLQSQIGTKERDIGRKQQELQNWQRDQQQVMNTRSLEFRKSMIQDIRKVVNQEAEKMGATLVLDTSDIMGTEVPTVLFAKAEMDISEIVLKELNKDRPNN